MKCLLLCLPGQSCPNPLKTYLPTDAAEPPLASISNYFSLLQLLKNLQHHAFVNGHFSFQDTISITATIIHDKSSIFPRS